jgi:hypothetical protein
MLLAKPVQFKLPLTPARNQVGLLQKFFKIPHHSADYAPEG